MNPTNRLRAARQRGDRGAALVEMAIVLPLVLLLLMGIIDFGFGLANLNSMRHGTRESVRRAVVADVGSDSACTITGVAVPTDETHELVCQIKSKTGLDDSKLRVKVLLDSEHSEGDALILCTQYGLESITGMFSTLLNNKTVHTEVHMRIEKTSSDSTDIAISNFQEQAPTGSNWNWCNG